LEETGFDRSADQIKGERKKQMQKERRNEADAMPSKLPHRSAAETADSLSEDRPTSMAASNENHATTHGNTPVHQSGCIWMLTEPRRPKEHANAFLDAETDDLQETRVQLTTEHEFALDSRDKAMQKMRGIFQKTRRRMASLQGRMLRQS
jgi:hypothetical protein